MYLETINDGGSPIFEDISTFSSFNLCSILIIEYLTYSRESFLCGIEADAVSLAETGGSS